MGRVSIRAFDTITETKRCAEDRERRIHHNVAETPAAQALLQKISHHATTSLTEKASLNDSCEELRTPRDASKPCFVGNNKTRRRPRHTRLRRYAAREKSVTMYEIVHPWHFLHESSVGAALYERSAFSTGTPLFGTNYLELVCIGCCSSTRVKRGRSVRTLNVCAAQQQQ